VTVCAGVDGCKGGWIAVWRPSAGELRSEVFHALAHLEAALLPDAIIAIDIPIGLPDRIEGTGRPAEQAVRKKLPGKASSVFSVPSRSAIKIGRQSLEIHPYSKAYDLTKSEARATSFPAKALSRQAFGILPKIAETDDLLRRNLPLANRIFESHPEMAFCALNAMKPMLFSKTRHEGANERRRVLAKSGLSEDALHAPPPRGAKIDDFLDACAMLLVAERIKDGTAISYPNPPSKDAYGLPIAIWA
jgi:predicted RNase H-like nuclease